MHHLHEPNGDRIIRAKTFYAARGHPRAVEQSSDLLRRTRFLARVALVGTAVLLILLIAIPLIVPHEILPEPIIVFWGVFILLAALIAGIAAAYLFLSRAQVLPAPASSGSPPGPGEAASPDALQDLAVRLLDGDERRVLRVIVEAKGEILQRDIVRVTSFSDAKVSRLLDRLEGRGLVVRERHGMTNRVRLTLGQT